ncbi:MAG: carboxymuconolactone decarboxylase family protein [Gemmatimonadales bacterium]
MAALQTEAAAAAADLDPAEQALVRYAERLTQRPAGVTAGDIVALRTAGLDDRAIHDACVIVAYFAYVNRIADGLGVELESER